MQVQSLGREESLEEEMVTHLLHILARIIPWTRILVGSSPWGLKESDKAE